MILAAFLLLIEVVAAAAVTTERIVVDPQTGLALYGYDPVAYFTGGGPRLGKPEFELTFAGAIWRFANEGNLAAFRDAPAVYTPRYGGHCAMAAARASISDGKPQIWAIRDDRLYLFFSIANRAAWQTDPDRAIGRAEANWPQLQLQLAR